jgi:hypothetical protein
MVEKYPDNKIKRGRERSSVSIRSSGYITTSLQIPVSLAKEYHETKFSYTEGFLAGAAFINFLMRNDPEKEPMDEKSIIRELSLFTFYQNALSVRIQDLEERLKILKELED